MRSDNILVGIIIAIIGICCLLENFGINLDWGILISILLIFSSIFLSIKNKRISFWSILLFIIGIWNLLYNFRLVTIELGEILWPVLLIIIGLSLILNKLRSSKKVKSIIGKEKKLSYNGIFSNVNEKIVDEKVELIIINSIFGNVQLDLSELKLANELKIEVYSIFGKTNLLLMDDYNIVLESTSIFGGIDNKHEKKQNKSKHTININTVNIFGGTNLK